MIFRKILVLLIGLVSGGACLASEFADRVFIHGAVWTGQHDGVDAQAVALKGNKILFAGSDADIAAYIGPDTEMIDLGGKFLMPGMVDNHVHFEQGALGLTRVQLRGVATRDEFVQRIAEAAAKAAPGTWILRGSWDHELWGGELPDRTWIDARTGDVPVAVTRLDEHMLLANTAALKAAGIDDNTPSPDGGVIVRDAAGRATGILKDNAMLLMNAAIPPASDDEMEAAFVLGMAHAAQNGITQVHDMGWDWRTLETFRRLHAQGKMAMRVYAFTPLAEWQKLADYVAINGRGDDWVRWGGLKGFVDGSLGSTTAWLYEPYVDAPETNGFPINDMTILSRNIADAARAGLHVTVHAIGFQANDRLLDAFETAAMSAGREDLRFRVEHAQHVTESAIKRFTRLGVIASMHPYHVIDDGRWAEKRLGKEGLKGSYAIGSLMGAGTKVTFGSDWPVAPLEPLMGVYAAVSRHTGDGKNPGGWLPKEKVSVADALRAYTQTNAYAGFQEDRLGMIKAGYLADMVVLSDNPFSLAPDDLSTIRVLRTVVGGEDRYSAE